MANVWGDGHGVMGVGYEGRTIESLVDELSRWRVTTLVDVRLNAISRKRGFSKRGLEAALRAGGIKYLHIPQLGNPRENREAYSAPGTPEGTTARATYEALLESEPAQNALDQLVQLVSVERIVVMCFEEYELRCHRHQVLEALHARTDELVVV